METKPLAPVTDDFLGQMCSIPIQSNAPEQLQKFLFEKYAIEIPVTRQDDKIFIRYSINAFNAQADLDVLYTALSETLQGTDFLHL
jgi:isopenicillin-N epimerase